MFNSWLRGSCYLRWLFRFKSSQHTRNRVWILELNQLANREGKGYQRKCHFYPKWSINGNMRQLYGIQKLPPSNIRIELQIYPAFCHGFRWKHRICDKVQIFLAVCPLRSQIVVHNILFLRNNSCHVVASAMFVHSSNEGWPNPPLLAGIGLTLNFIAGTKDFMNFGDFGKIQSIEESRDNVPMMCLGVCQ